MTKSNLFLVTPETSVEAANKPSDQDKTVIAEYVQDLKRRGFCKIDDASSNQTRLFNRFNQRVLPPSFIENDFSAWLYMNRKRCEFRSITYILYTLQHVIGSKFVPRDIAFVTESDTKCSFVNTYKPYRPTTDSADVSPLFLEFLERLVPAAGERHIFVQWLAHIFQRPEQRPSWHILLTSEPGTGKGFLVQDVLHPLLHHTSVVADYSKVMGRFSNVLEDGLLVLLDDCKARSESTQTQLKSLLSEERTYCEKKQLQGGMVDTYTRFVLASNEHKPLTLEASERRWFVPARLMHKEDRHETQTFIASLAAWLGLPGSLCKVYNFFMSYPLEGFNHKCVPNSEGLIAIVGMSKNPYGAFLEDFIAENTVFAYASLVAALKEEGLTKPSDRHMVHLLREVGYEKSQPRIDGKLKRLFHPIGMSLDEIRAAYAETEMGFDSPFDSPLIHPTIHRPVHLST